MSPRRREPAQDEAAIENQGIPWQEAERIAGVAANTAAAWRTFLAIEAETRPVPRFAIGYVNATHPDTGLAVVFVPGEKLPSWATEGD